VAEVVEHLPSKHKVPNANPSTTKERKEGSEIRKEREGKKEGKKEGRKEGRKGGRELNKCFAGSQFRLPSLWV
jgi:flagellar biosynthesis/type III secretory pathway protein FliH